MEMQQDFRRRGYDKKNLAEAHQRALALNRRDLLRFQPKDKPEKMTMVQTYSKVHQRLPIWLCQRVAFCSTTSPSDDVSVVYQNGLPVITISLPSRREQCRFTLKPISDTVGVFLKQVQAEDRGVDRVAIYSTDGERISSSTSIEVLLLDDFRLSINDKDYLVRPPKRELLCHEDATTMNDLKTLVQQLYSSMRVEDHQLNKEQELYRRLEVLREQLEPLEQVRLRIAQRAAKKTRYAQWGMLAYMSVQFGVFARLTWWEYSWDIMEPVTYFVTYGTGIAGCAYYILTGKEYLYADASDRQFLHYFHRAAKKENFDVIEYNRLKDAIAQAELDLKRLRDPLQLHLPIQQIDAKD